MGITLSLLCFGIGCGDFCLFCDDDENSQDPCNPDPCEDITDATADTCTPVGETGFACDCDAGYAWNAESDACEEVSTEDCDDLKTCLKGCNVVDSACQNDCLEAGSACECDIDLYNPPFACGSSCQSQCDADPQACWECGVDCVFNTRCP